LVTRMCLMSLIGAHVWVFQVLTTLLQRVNGDNYNES